MANITKVYLLAVPLEKDYVHTLYFETAGQQSEYFQSKRVKEYSDFSYQRKDGILRIPEHIDTLLSYGCNYVMYRNMEYSDKWFYAFIEDMEYINDGRTDLKIRTDCIQTWMFNIKVNPSFVEREHAATDEIGDHTLEEGLETGEYVLNDITKFTYGSNLSVVIGVNKVLAEGGAGYIGGSLYNGVYSGLLYYVFNDTSANDINEFIKAYDEAGAGDAIICMFLAPDVLAANPEDGKIHNGEQLPGSAAPDTVVINKPFDRADFQWGREIVHEFSKNNIDGYEPRNKKLMCFPYRYLLASNNAGTTVPYKFERFYVESEDGKKTLYEPTFAIYGVLTIGCSVRMMPLCYNGIKTENEDEGITMGKFPAVNWSSDAYTNWLTQNGVNIGINLVSGAAQIIGGAAIAIGSSGAMAGIGGGTVIGGVTQIATTLGQKHQQSYAPAQAKGNLNSGDVTTARKLNTFFFSTMSVKKEFAAIIDEYFDMFGYKCNRVKTPEKAHRAAYWFTKTIDANIIGNIPQQDLQTIKDCYNKGITFWRPSAIFRNYDPTVNPNGITKEG